MIILKTRNNNAEQKISKSKYAENMQNKTQREKKTKNKCTENQGVVRQL